MIKLSSAQITFIMLLEILPDNLLVETKEGLEKLLNKYKNVSEEVTASDKLIVELIEKEMARRMK